MLQELGGQRIGGIGRELRGVAAKSHIQQHRARRLVHRDPLGHRRQQPRRRGHRRPPQHLGRLLGKLRLGRESQAVNRLLHHRRADQHLGLGGHQ